MKAKTEDRDGGKRIFNDHPDHENVAHSYTPTKPSILSKLGPLSLPFSSEAQSQPPNSLHLFQHYRFHSEHRLPEKGLS